MVPIGILRQSTTLNPCKPSPAESSWGPESWKAATTLSLTGAAGSCPGFPDLSAPPYSLWLVLLIGWGEERRARRAACLSSAPQPMEEAAGTS